MAAALVILEGQGAGSEHPLDGEVVLGRERSSADVVLVDPGVSRRHAAIRAERGRVTVTDLGSSNGTYANGHRIDGAAVLAPGDEIELGSTVVTVRERRQPSMAPRRLDDESNIPALASAFLGPLSIFILVASAGAAFFASLPVGIAAIVLARIGRRRDDHRTLASIGRVTGIIGAALSVLALVAWVVLVVVLDAAGDTLTTFG